MTDVTIVSTEEMGDLVKIVVYVEGDKKFYVNLEKQDAATATDEYIEELKTGTDFDYYSNCAEQTLFLPVGYTQADLDAALRPIKDDLNKDDFEKLQSTGPKVQETIYSNGSNNKNCYKIENAPQATINHLTSVFPDVDLSAIGMISNAAYHEVLQEEVITAYMLEWGATGLVQNGRNLLAKCRKYCMSQGGYYDREYIYSTGSYSFLPSEATIIARSDNINATEGLVLPDFFDVYFDCDPDIAEAHFGLDPLRGEYSTYYAVTVVNGEVVRKKQYIYNEQSTFSDWVATKNRIDEAHGVS